MNVIVSTVSQAPWMTEGACRTEDPDLFFPISAQGAGARQAERAVSVCRRCGVRAECLRFALVNGQRHGVWGGLTEQERLGVLRTRRDSEDG